MWPLEPLGSWTRGMQWRDLGGTWRLLGTLSWKVCSYFDLRTLRAGHPPYIDGLDRFRMNWLHFVAWVHQLSGLRYKTQWSKSLQSTRGHKVPPDFSYCSAVGNSLSQIHNRWGRDGVDFQGKRATRRLLVSFWSLLYLCRSISDTSKGRIGISGSSFYLCWHQLRICCQFYSLFYSSKALIGTDWVWQHRRSFQVVMNFL